MRRILNLNGFSAPALRSILLIGFVLPALLLLLGRGLDLHWLTSFSSVLLTTGVVMLLLFFALVVLELIQDDVLYRVYLREREKQPEVDGECQFCGNRLIHEFERICPICGTEIRHAVQTRESYSKGRNVK